MPFVKFLRKHWSKTLIAFVLLYIFLPIDDIEESLGMTSGRMSFITKHGRLAPYPKERTHCLARHSPSWFTDEYFIFFSAKPDIITAWLKQSPGVVEGKAETLSNGSTRYYLKSDAVQGHLDVTSDLTQVGIVMGFSWDGLTQAPLVPTRQ
jgi:hypothetical protein